MRRVKPEIVLYVGLIFGITLAVQALAADVKSKEWVYKLDEIVVTATRMETSEQKVAANITVITRDDMKKMPASNAAEVLQYIPGIYVEFNGGLGSQAGAAIQGSDFRHVAVYQDGVPLNMLLNPVVDLSYLPIDNIERIEIYKGAASSAWGSSLGGVINIITKEPDPKKPFATEVQASFGEFDTLKSRGTFGGTADRFGYLLSLTHDESDGFIDHTEYEQDAIYGKVNYELGEISRVNFAYSHNKGSNADPVLNWPDFWDDLDRKRTYQRLLFETFPTENSGLIVEGRHHRFFTRADDVFSDHREIFNDYDEETWGVSARFNYHAFEAKNTLGLGFDEDWGEYHYVSEVFGDDIERSTRNWATYVNDTHSVGDLSLNAGIRYDDNADFGSAISPSAGAVYRIAGEDALIRAQVAKGFSAPPSVWVNHPEIGNKDLEPEIGTNYQLGGEVRPFKFLWLELNLFRAEIEDLINYNWDTQRYENIDKVTRQGVEGNIRAAFDFGLALSFGGSYVDVRDEETDEVIEDIPRTLFNVSASYTHEWMTHSIVGKYVDHNSSYPETHDKVFVFDFLVKVKLPFPDQYGKLNLFGAVYNLTNESYVYRAVFPQPDRWVEGGVNFEY